MASFDPELVKALLAATSPAKPAAAAGQGVAEGFAQEAESRKAAFQRKLQEAGLVPPGLAQQAVTNLGFTIPKGELQEPVKPELISALTSTAKRPEEKFQMSKEDLIPILSQQNQINAMLGQPEVDVESMAERLSQMPASAAKDIFQGLYRGQGMMVAGQAFNPELKGRLASAGTAAKTFTETATKINELLPKIDVIMAKAEQLPDYREGLVGQAVAQVDVFKKRLSADPALKEFEQAVDSITGSIAKGVQGQDSRLSDTDVKLAKKVITDPFLPKELRRQMLGRLKAYAYYNYAAAARQAGRIEDAEQAMETGQQLSGISPEELKKGILSDIKTGQKEVTKKPTEGQTAAPLSPEQYQLLFNRLQQLEKKAKE